MPLTHTLYLSLSFTHSLKKTPVMQLFAEQLFYFLGTASLSSSTPAPGTDKEPVLSWCCNLKHWRSTENEESHHPISSQPNCLTASSICPIQPMIEGTHEKQEGLDRSPLFFPHKQQFHRHFTASLFFTIIHSFFLSFFFSETTECH